MVTNNGARLSIPAPPAHLHFVGIGGIGVSGLARLLRARGYNVSGSDMIASDITESLEAEGIKVAIGHDALHVEGADVVIATAAAKADNVELVTAGEKRIPVVKRAAVLGLLARDFRTLAVAGTHGKSTTSGMAAVALDEAGLHPGFAVGAIVPPFGTNARDSKGEYFVVEADEYDYSFLQLEPDVAIVTNIEHDHPDLFPDFEHVLDAFHEFIKRIRPGGALVISANDPGCWSLLERLDASANFSVITFGTDSADWTISEDSVVSSTSGQMFELPLSVPGRHNRLNALAVLASAAGLGIDVGMLIGGLSSFRGVGRRFEVIRDDSRLVVVSDYAHHPTEIVATVGAARERYPNRRIVILFQPHTYSRTKAMVAEFARALDTGDSVVLADIYAARETDDLGVSSQAIADQMHLSVDVRGTPRDAAGRTRQIIQDGDVVLVLGAGDVVQVAAEIAGVTL
jgi:UDP-N-acetylmuramate--alanine ligase